MKICHMTSAHPPEDIRIFVKECVSLADFGHEVYLVEQGDTYDKKGVHIIGVGSISHKKKNRMTKGAKMVYTKAKSLNADVYHFHDPELLPYALKLMRQGKKVIYDSHEDVPAQIMDKKWIPQALRKIVSATFKKYETHVCKRISAVVAATPYIAKQFANRSNRVVVVNNFPKLDDIEFHDTPFIEREPIVCYAGGINELRGEKIMIEAMKEAKGKLIMAGDHEVMQLGSNVEYAGRLNRKKVNELYGKSVVGLCILKPIENYYYSQPIKMYEYMAAGIPFICSDFPGWKQVVNDSGAGICVNPDDISSITEAINYLLNNRNEAQSMGKKGFDYVSKNCNWASEMQSLAKLYTEL